MSKRILAMLLAFVMVIGLLPLSALAAGAIETPEVSVKDDPSVTLSFAGGSGSNQDPISFADETIGISAVFTAGTHTTKPRWDTSLVRFYGTSSVTNHLTVAAPEGYVITGIAFNMNGSYGLSAVSADSGTINTDTHTWTGSANSVVFTTTAQTRFEGVTVTYQAVNTTCEHANTTLTGATAPDCTNDGYTGDRVCDDCGTYVKQGDKIPALGHDIVDGKCAAEGCDVTEITGYKLLTDVADLKQGMQIVIVGEHASDDGVISSYAMSTNQKSNNRGTVAVTHGENTVTWLSDDAVQVITLAAGASSGTYALDTNGDSDGGYLYAAGADKNYLRTQETIDANASFAITITEGVTSVIATESTNRNVLRFNYGDDGTNTLFSCYAGNSTTGAPVSIYYLPGTGFDCEHTTTEVVPAVPATCTEAGSTVGQKCTVCGTIIGVTVIDALGHDWDENGTCKNGCNTTKLVDPAAIVDALYALSAGATLENGPYTLTGEIISVDTVYSTQYSNVTVTMVVEGKTDKPVQAYRLKGQGADKICVGDTITVTGNLKHYYKETSTYEFDSGCTLDAVVGDGHTYESEITTESTCTTDGVKTSTCTVCGYIKEESIPAGHNHVYDASTGISTCSGCGHILATVTLTAGANNVHMTTNADYSLKFDLGDVFGFDGVTLSWSEGVSVTVNGSAETSPYDMSNLMGKATIVATVEAETDATFTVTVPVVENPALVLGNNDITVNDAYNGQVMTFTAETYGEYKLSASEGEENADVMIETDTGAETITLPYTFLLDEGAAKTFIVFTTGATPDVISLTLEKVETVEPAEEYVTLEAGSNALTLVPNTNYNLRLDLGSLTSPSGVTLSWTEGVTVKMDGAVVTSPADMSGYGMRTMLVATVNAETNAIFTVTVPVVELSKLVLGDNDIDVPAGYTGVNYEFTAAEAGEYVLSAAAGETNCYLMNVTTGDMGLTLPYTFTLAAGETIEFNISAYNYLADTINLVLTKTPAGPVVDESIELKHNLNLESSLGINFGILTKYVADAEDFYVVIEKEEGRLASAQNIELTIYKDAMTYNGADRYYAAFPEIAACEMGVELTATLYIINADGSITCSNPDVFSVQEYAEIILGQYRGSASTSNTTTKAYKSMQLMVELLKYGAAAQEKFNYKTDALVTTSLQASDYAYEIKDITAVSSRDWGANDGEVTFKSSNLNLESQIISNIKIDISNLKACELNGLTAVVTAGGTVVQEIRGEDFDYTATNQYYIPVTAINASNMRTLYKITVYANYGTDAQVAVTSEATYTVESYVALTNNDKVVATAALRYGDAAQKYFAK